MAASSSFSGLPCVLPLFSFILAAFGQPSQPIVSSPFGRVDSGALATFNCRSEGFPLRSRGITVTWTKDGNPIEAGPHGTLLDKMGTFRVIGVVRMTLTEKDINSRLTCHIHHSSTERPLQQSFDLRDALRVAPQVTVETSLSPPIPLNRSVRLTCVVNNFYPNNITVAWWRSDYRNFTQRNLFAKTNQDGTFSLRFPLSTRQNRPATTNYTCQVIHDSRSPVYVNEVLKFGMPPEENGNLCFSDPGLFLLSSPGLWIGLLLGKIVTALLLYLLLRKSANFEH
ncbi:signal-regulatory protein beta-1-like [Eublepharis macularius]|uniref:Signal-regulatory protein beta-1-like n=1 Tax=Eublepharis macularius TaxID=481883 RepID=A0AA97JFE3_EUBMA|nr:signal-regulatory protein beta-1-like [Eublepharis macularius]